MKDRRRGGSGWLRAAALLCAALSLAACSSTDTTDTTDRTTDVTLEEAKAKLLALQHEIIGMVPQDLVVSLFESDTSSLLSCDGENQKKWTGTGQVELQPGLDRDKFLDDVRDTVSGQSGWTAKDAQDGDGARTVEILHDDGTHLIVGIWDGPESLQIDGFSACFDFPEYQYGEKY